MNDIKFIILLSLLTLICIQYLIILIESKHFKNHLNDALRCQTKEDIIHHLKQCKALIPFFPYFRIACIVLSVIFSVPIKLIKIYKHYKKVPNRVTANKLKDLSKV